jgi:hypothetical protein
MENFVYLFYFIGVYEKILFLQIVDICQVIFFIICFNNSVCV